MENIERSTQRCAMFYFESLLFKCFDHLMYLSMNFLCESDRRVSFT